MADIERVCECCRRKFTARSADVARGWARFCSKRCKAVKQEARTGQHRDHLARQSERDFSDAQADQSWGEHEQWSTR